MILFNSYFKDNRLAWIVASIMVLGTFVNAFDGLHYWHDIRFMFATTQFSLQDIFSGQFNPHQAWSPINEQSTSGFYLGKALHIVLLKLLFWVIEPHQGGLIVAVSLSFIAMAITVTLCHGIFSELLPSKPLALFAVASVIVCPITAYLVGKLLSENTSLLLTTVSLLLLVKSQVRNRNSGLWLVFVSGVFLGLACLARLDSLFGPIGFAIALVCFPVGEFTRRRSIQAIALVFAVAAFVYGVGFWLAGGHVDLILSYFEAFIGANQKPPLMSLIGFMTFGGFLLLTAILSVFSRRKRLLGFFTLWLACSWVPAIGFTWHYMVEPRYLVQGLIPLAGLSALGAEVVYSTLTMTLRSNRFVLVFATLSLVVINGFLVRLMPYELDRPALLAAVEDIQRPQAAAILVPWSYTDFNFLRVMLPNVPIYNVNAPSADAVDTQNVAEWHRRFQKWYGSNYLTTTDSVNKLLDSGPVYYLGWEFYPPLQRVVDLIQNNKWTGFSFSVDQLGLLNHLEQSWLWASQDFKVNYQARVGQYLYYMVVRTDD